MFLLAGVFGVIGVAVFGASVGVAPAALYWAYWLTVVGSALFLVPGVLAALASCQNDNRIMDLS